MGSPIASYETPENSKDLAEGKNALSNRPLRSLRFKNVRLFLTGQFLSVTGTWMERIIVTWLVYNITGSAWMLGLASTVSMLPSLLFSYQGGRLADAIAPKKIILSTQLLATALATTLLVLTAFNSLGIYPILLITFLVGVANAFEVSARQVLIPSLVPDHPGDIANAIALNSICLNSARFVGPLLAASIVPLFGITGCFLINVLSFLFSIITVKYLRPKKPKEKDCSKGECEKLSLLSATKVIFKDPFLSNLFFLSIALGLFTFQYHTLIPAFIAKSFSGEISALSFMTSASALGAILGGLAIAGINKTEILWRGIGFLAIAGALLILALSYTSQLSLALIINGLLGALLVMQTSGNQTLRQLLIKGHRRGRILSLFLTAYLGMMSLGAVLTGSIASSIGILATYRLIALLTLASALMYLLKTIGLKPGRFNQ